MSFFSEGQKSTPCTLSYNNIIAAFAATIIAIAEAKMRRVETLETYLKALTKAERMALLNSPDTLARVADRFNG